MSRTIYIMSGLPASGKSHWIQQNAKWGDTVCSRDDFRDLLRTQYNTDKYFPVSSKKEYQLWAEHLCRCLAATMEGEIYIDQTTLTQGALNKLLDAIYKELSPLDTICIVNIVASTDACIKRNAAREGHAKVPESVIYSMSTSRINNRITQEQTECKYPYLTFDYKDIFS